MRCVGLTGAQSPQEHWPNPAALTQVSRLNSKSKAPFRKGRFCIFILGGSCNGKDSGTVRVSLTMPAQQLELLQAYHYKKKHRIPTAIFVGK